MLPVKLSPISLRLSPGSDEDVEKDSQAGSSKQTNFPIVKFIRLEDNTDLPITGYFSEDGKSFIGKANTGAQYKVPTTEAHSTKRSSSTGPHPLQIQASNLKRGNPVQGAPSTQNKFFEKALGQLISNVNDTTLQLIREAEKNLANIIKITSNTAHHPSMANIDLENIDKIINGKKIYTESNRKLLIKHKILFGENSDTINRCNTEKLEEILSDKNSSELKNACTNFQVQQTMFKITENYFSQIRNGRKEFNKIYDPDNNGKYPLRNTEGKMIGIKAFSLLNEKEYDIKSTKHYKDEIKPFIQKNMKNEARRALYEKYLVVKKHTEENIRDGESSLVGQNGVFAVCDIPIATCIGLYGGTILSKEMDFGTPLTDDTYRLGLDDNYHLDGDNIISRINSCFEYNSNGEIAAQALKGYNIGPIKFKVLLTEKLPGGADQIELAAFFTDRAIKKGEDLRWNYGYTKEEIGKKFKQSVS